eukprot:SAG11_NODE_3887_length_2165_cov_1.650048_2_plen_328_part_00
MCFATPPLPVYAAFGGFAEGRTASLPADLHAHPLVVSGKLILQEKASCFPATALLPLPPTAAAHDRAAWPAWLRRALQRAGGTAAADSATASPGSTIAAAPALHVLDACAAPGNKTLQAAALLHALPPALLPPGAGVVAVTAFDRSKRRCALLRKRCDGAGGSGVMKTECAMRTEPSVLDVRWSVLSRSPAHACRLCDADAGTIRAVEGDWLSCNPRGAEYATACAVIVDPSCSGSGILANRKADDLRTAGCLSGGGGSAAPAAAAEASDLRRRLAELATFQVAAVVHAMRFPRYDQFQQRMPLTSCLWACFAHGSLVSDRGAAPFL